MYAIHRKRGMTTVEEKLNYFVRTKTVPHIIFHGASGTGKRTLVNAFLTRIYGGDLVKMKKHVMVVNCSHGKGIKFIREDLKFFARHNIQANHEVLFKSIVLLNADSLTIDAQSALRRCIELFSHNTRFFIVVENKHKLLNPILSRFCEIHVSEPFVGGRCQNLHQEHLRRVFPVDAHAAQKRAVLASLMGSVRGTQGLVRLATQLYEHGLSARDILQHPAVHSNALELMYHKIKGEFRSEKLLIFVLLYFGAKAVTANGSERLNEAMKNMMLL